MSLNYLIGVGFCRAKKAQMEKPEEDEDDIYGHNSKPHSRT